MSSDICDLPSLVLLAGLVVEAMSMPCLLYSACTVCASRCHIPTPKHLVTTVTNPIRTPHLNGWVRSRNLLGMGKPMVGTRITCMANPRRVKMVAKQIQRELSDMLLTDKVLQYAVLPEASLGADRYLSSLTTITDVQVSADLQA